MFPPLLKHTRVDKKFPSSVDASKATVHFPEAKFKSLHLKKKSMLPKIKASPSSLSFLEKQCSDELSGNQ